MQRASLALVIMRQKFCFVRGEIHVRRAFRLAGLAGEAQVERLLDLFVLPAAVDHLALQQFEEHVRASARAVLLFERHHVAGAHRAAVQLAAGAEADASRGGVRERAAIVGKFEMRLRLQRFVVRAQAQIFRGQVGIHNLMRIQLVAAGPRPP